MTSPRPSLWLALSNEHSDFDNRTAGPSLACFNPCRRSCPDFQFDFVFADNYAHPAMQKWRFLKDLAEQGLKASRNECHIQLPTCASRGGINDGSDYFGRITLRESGSLSPFLIFLQCGGAVYVRSLQEPVLEQQRE